MRPYNVEIFTQDFEMVGNTNVNEITYYLHSDLGYDTKDRDRIVPVVCEMQAVSHEEGSSFESAAISAAHNKFANAYQILEDSLNLKDSRVYDTIEEDRTGKHL